MRRPQSNQTAFALAVACLLALVPACSSGKNAAGVTDDNATADQYPSATLPFKARASGPKKGDNTYPFDGVEIGRSQYSRQAQGYVQEAHAILAVPVALPDVVAVIFPPADREGFDVAYAGFGKPWTREHLIDTPPDQVGALDAVATGDGGLVAVMRPRNETVPVTIIQWRPGTAATIETLTTEETAQSVGFGAERCPDISVAVDPTGGLAVLYRDFTTSEGSGRVMLAQRAKGASAWTRTVADQGNRPWYTNPGSGIFGEVGCKNRVAFDETGRPRVLTLHRGIPDSAADSLNPTMGTHAPGSWVTPLFLGADGRFHNESRSFGSTCECYGGEFDVDVNPDGEILAGPASQSAKPNLYLTVLSFIGIGFKGTNSPIFQWASGDPNTRLGGSPQVDECGRAPVLMSAWLGYWSMGGQPGGCWMQRRAPVMFRTDDEGNSATLKYPTPAHGVRPYNAVLCLRDDDTLEICSGSYTPDPSSTARGDLPVLVSSTPADGAVDVDPALNEIVLKFDRPTSVATISDVEFMDTSDNVGGVAFASVDVSTPGEVHVVMKAPLTGNHRFRLAVAIGKDWQYPSGKRPVLTFRTKGEPRPADPRDLPLVLHISDTDFTRDPDGTFRVVAKINWQSASAGVALPQTQADALSMAGKKPLLQEASGAAVKDYEYIFPTGLTWKTAPLKPDTEYVVTFPDDVTDFYGLTFAPLDRVVHFRTAP